MSNNSGVLTEDVVETARQYYNSGDADRFYHRLWGGEDIHVGMYSRPDEPVREASGRTVAFMADLAGEVDATARLLDIGAGYGGSARFLVRKFNCRVTCLNLSEVQNERNRMKNRESGLSGKIDVVDGDFENLPFARRVFDGVWSQDAILHSGNRRRVFQEVDRVLQSGGWFVFSDLLQEPGASPEALAPVLERIHLPSLGSTAAYLEYAGSLGWEVGKIHQFPQHLVGHYSAIRRELARRREELSAHCSPEYLERMLRGLAAWVEAGESGTITWAVFTFRKP